MRLDAAPGTFLDVVVVVVITGGLPLESSEIIVCSSNTVSGGRFAKSSLFGSYSII